MNQYSMITFRKSETEIRDNYNELVKGKTVPVFYQNLLDGPLEKTYLPIFLFKGEIEGKEERVYKNINHSAMVTPVVYSISRGVSYDGNNKSGTAKFKDYPIVANSEFRHILMDTFGCESTLEPFQYKDAIKIEDMNQFQFDEKVAPIDIEDDKLLVIAKENMEHVLSVRMFENATGSFVGGIDQYKKLVDGRIVFVPIYYKKVVVERAGVVYVIANGESGEVYINILDQIDGYLPFSKIAKYGITAVWSIVSIAMGILVFKTVTFLSLKTILYIFVVAGVFFSLKCGLMLEDLIFRKQVKDLRKHCMHDKDIAYFNSGIFYIDPGSLMIR